jgi:hypothetical protein
VDRIEPIPPRPPATEPIPAIRRGESATDKRDQPDRRKQGRPRPPHREPPPDDGRPHVDITV